MNTQINRRWRTTGDITVDNYRKFKPSVFINTFIDDIDTAIAIGKPMDMSSFTQVRHCLPCLGGMACMNMGLAGIRSLSEKWIAVSPYGRDYATIARLGDAIRLGDMVKVSGYVKVIWGVDIGRIVTRGTTHGMATVVSGDGWEIIVGPFIGMHSMATLEELKRQVANIAGIYEKYGY